MCYVPIQEVTFLSSNKKSTLKLNVKREIHKIDLFKDIAYVIFKLNQSVKTGNAYLCLTLTKFPPFSMALANFHILNIIMFHREDIINVFSYYPIVILEIKSDEQCKARIISLIIYRFRCVLE